MGHRNCFRINLSWQNRFIISESRHSFRIDLNICHRTHRTDRTNGHRINPQIYLHQKFCPLWAVRCTYYPLRPARSVILAKSTALSRRDVFVVYFFCDWCCIMCYVMMPCFIWKGIVTPICGGDLNKNVHTFWIRYLYIFVFKDISFLTPFLLTFHNGHLTVPLLWYGHPNPSPNPKAPFTRYNLLSNRVDNFGTWRLRYIWDQFRYMCFL